MSTVKIGDSAPEISAVDQHGERIELCEYRGRQPVVIFFYPADDSPICTKEACSFRDAYEEFVDAGAVVIGISGDDPTSHQRFASRHRLPFHLLADTEGTMRRSFGVPKSLGLLPGRVTYVVDKEGVVRQIFSSQFSAERHVREALRILRQLRESAHGA
jgi:peroxiredoxin Q/BCP